MKNQYLKKITLFAHMSDDELEILSNSLKKQHYSKNELVFQEGTTADRLYIILSGKVKIFKL